MSSQKKMLDFKTAENTKSSKRLKGCESIDIEGFKVYVKESRPNAKSGAAAFSYCEPEQLLSHSVDFIDLTKTFHSNALVKNSFLTFPSQTAKGGKSARAQLKSSVTRRPLQIRPKITESHSKADAEMCRTPLRPSSAALNGKNTPAKASLSPIIAITSPSVTSKTASSNAGLFSLEKDTEVLVSDFKRKSLSGRKSLVIVDNRKSSTAIGATALAALSPPSNVSFALWHSAIDTQLPDTVRMHTLFVWSLKYLMDSSTSPIALAEQEKKCCERVLGRLISKDLNTSWYLNSNCLQSPSKEIALYEDVSQMQKLLDSKNEQFEAISRSAAETCLFIENMCDNVAITKSVDTFYSEEDRAILERNCHIKRQIMEFNEQIKTSVASLNEKIASFEYDVELMLQMSEVIEDYAADMHLSLTRRFMERRLVELSNVDPMILLKKFSTSFKTASIMGEIF